MVVPDVEDLVVIFSLAESKVGWPILLYFVFRARLIL